MFITQFSIKWRARLNKLHLYLSITKHESHFFYFLQLLHVFFYLHPRIPHIHPFKLQLSSRFRVLRVTKKQLKIIYCFARFNWLRFMDVEWEQHQSQNRENPFTISITHVSSHKSCFYKLTFFITHKTRSLFLFLLSLRLLWVLFLCFLHFPSLQMLFEWGILKSSGRDSNRVVLWGRIVNYQRVYVCVWKK